MDSNLAVHESTFKGPQGDPDELDLHREDNILRLRKRYAPTKLVKVDDNFIVDDWDESVAPQKIEHRLQSKRGATRTGSDLQWTLDFSYIYDMVTGKAATIQTMSKQKMAARAQAKNHGRFDCKFTKRVGEFIDETDSKRNLVSGRNEHHRDHANSSQGRDEHQQNPGG